MAVQRDKVIASAEKLVAKGKIEPAIKEYERLLEDNPNDVNTLNRIGDLWVRINRNDEAVKVFTKIADHYSKDGFFLKAIAIYKKINKLDPSKLEIYAKLADLYAKQGLAMEAKSQYQVLADYYLKHGEPANALGIYRKISELDPNSINVHVKLADLYSQNNQTAEALKEYDRVGRMLLKRGMLEESVQVFRKALKIDPKNMELVESLVTALLDAKDYNNAQAIIDAAAEANPDNPKLLAMWGKIQLGRGDAAAARATLERAVKADPNEPSVRDALMDLYLKQGDAERALEMATPLVERALARGERGAAIETLNRVLRIDSGHAPTLERMVAVYTRLNEETNILSSMNSLAEAHIARTRWEEAAKVLEKLIQREPQNSQHRTKLQFVRSQIGGVETLPPRKSGPQPAAPPQPAPSIPPMEIEEPAPSFDFSEEPAMSLGLDDSAPVELDFELEPPSPSPAPAPTPAAPPPAQQLRPAVEMAAADLSESGDDLDFITEHLTEAEVFAKYGLAEKAAEHLRAVLERAPKNLTAHERLYRILLEEGDAETARSAAMAYVGVLQEKGETDAIDAVRNEFLLRGQSLDTPKAAPARPAVSHKTTEAAISLDDIAADEPEITFDVEAPAEIEFDLEAPEPVIQLEPEPAPEPAPALVEEFVEEIELAPETEPEPVIELAPELEPEPVIELAPEAELDFGLEAEAPIELGTVEEPETLLETEVQAEPEPVMETAEPFFGVEGLEEQAAEPPLEEIGEIDFYIEQELYDEARGKLDALSARFPDNADLDARRERIDAGRCRCRIIGRRPSADPLA